MMNVVQHVDNRQVYSSPIVAAHYASLKYLTNCERFLFDMYLRPGMAILDAGVGGGRTTARLSSDAGRYVGIDYSEPMIDKCRARFPKLEFFVADAADLTIFSDGSFDAVVMAFNAVDYIVPATQRWRCFSECRRVLKHGGVLIFSSHNPRSLLVRAAWDKERVRAFAEKVVAASSIWFPVAVSALTVLKAMHAFGRAVTASFGRVVRRFPKSVFWRGEGHMIDSAHGGLLTHYWVPRRVIAELSCFNFQLTAIEGNEYPRKTWSLATDWYYYVFTKFSGPPDCGDSCT